MVLKEPVRRVKVDETCVVDVDEHGNSTSAEDGEGCSNGPREPYTRIG